jgi:hypothetical protein
MRRKHILLKNEIENLQMIVNNKIYVANFYKVNLIKRLEELKRKWYKVRGKSLTESKEVSK